MLRRASRAVVRKVIGCSRDACKRRP